MINGNNVKFARYENVYNNLKKILELYLSKYDAKKIINLNQKQKQFNEDAFSNSLIENDFNFEEIVKEIKDSYLSRDYIQGEIGLIDEGEQYDGIFNITLYMLMSNRMSKYYQQQINKNNNLCDEARKKYEDMYKKLLSLKIDATTKLIYSLFIYKETQSNDDFYYGHRIDNYGNDTLVIDLPVYGQISVHFGSKSNMEQVLHIAKQSAQKIMQRKLELGQISQKEYEEIVNKLENEEVFPEYTGKLYEYSSMIPLDYCGEKYEQVKKDLDLSNKNLSELSEVDIERISQNTKYNSRELYYFAVKSDLTKGQLELLSKYLQKRDKEINNQKIDVNEMGREAIKLTTAEERQAIMVYEKNVKTTKERDNK